MTTRDIWDHLTAAITELLADRSEEPGTLADSTKLNADLGISSVEAIHLMIMLEERLNVPLNFQELAVRDGEYVDDLQLHEIRSFIARTMGTSDAATQ